MSRGRWCFALWESYVTTTAAASRAAVELDVQSRWNASLTCRLYPAGSGSSWPSIPPIQEDAGVENRWTDRINVGNCTWKRGHLREISSMSLFCTTHPSSTLPQSCRIRAAGAARAYPTARRPGEVGISLQGETLAHPQEFLTHCTCTILDCRRKPGKPERSRADTGRTCKPPAHNQTCWAHTQKKKIVRNCVFGQHLFDTFLITHVHILLHVFAALLQRKFWTQLSQRYVCILLSLWL